MPPPATAADREVSKDPAELVLLRPWQDPFTPRRLLRDTVVSIGAHVLLISFVLWLPEVERLPQQRVITPDLHRAVHLFLPKFYEPTQRAPNQGKVTRELDIHSMQEAPQPQAPRFRPPAPAPGPVAQAPAPRRTGAGDRAAEDRGRPGAPATHRYRPAAASSAPDAAAARRNPSWRLKTSRPLRCTGQSES